MKTEPLCGKDGVLHKRKHGRGSADRRICIHYIESLIHLLSKSEASRLRLSSVAMWLSLCHTWPAVPCGAAHIINVSLFNVSCY